MSTEPEVVDATIVDEHPPEPEPSTSVALAPRQRRSEVIRPLDADALVESFAAYQALLPRLLSASDYQSTGFDRDGVEKKFVKKSGWRKVAAAFDLDVVRVGDSVERDESGQPIRATATYRAIAPSGRAMDGDGYCSVEEERFGKPGDNAWTLAKKRAKLENDLRATATTRAKNRAISDLVGMGEVSAEEISAGEAHEPGPTYGDPISADSIPKVHAAIRFLLGEDLPWAEPPESEPVYEAIAGDAEGYMPRIVGRSLLRVAAVLKARLASEPDADEPEPVEHTGDLAGEN